MVWSFSDTQLIRYSRQIILEQIGGEGQEKLLRSRVLIVGAGGLGCPVALYLAAAGVGTIGIVDHDCVEPSNLHRQIAHSTKRVGTPKPNSVAEAIAALNPDIQVDTYPTRLSPENADTLISAYDVVADGSDNVATRYLVNDTCFRLKKPLISAAVRGFAAQLYSFSPPGPCYRCLYPDAPDDERLCTREGILGSVSGVAGTLQATEIIKEILGIGERLHGHMLVLDTLSLAVRRVRLTRDPACVICGEHQEAHVSVEELLVTSS